MFRIFLCLFVAITVSYAYPLNRVLVDMTYVFDETTLKFPISKPYEMVVIMNGSNDEFAWLQYEEFSTGVHVGTHMDAPAHFIKGATELDKIPLQQLIAPAAVIDITERAKEDPDAFVLVEDLLNWESVTQQSLDGTVIFMKSGWGKFWSNETAYFGNAERDYHNLHYPGLAPEAAQWLVENRKIKGVGSETLSVDNGPSSEYESHVILLGAGIYVLENVANVDQLPIYGAIVYVLPMKLGRASGAPTRILATYPEVIFDPPKHEE